MTFHEDPPGFDSSELVRHVAAEGKEHETNKDGISNAFAKHSGVSLSWSDVNMTVRVDKKKTESSDFHVLKNVLGSAHPGQTTAIMGPSGAGKTSLFKILAGRSVSKGNITISGTVKIGNHTLDAYSDNTKSMKLIRDNIAFVAQEDSLHSTSTPREAIYFSARLRLPKSTTDQAIKELVDVYIKELGLEGCADTVIGEGFKQGISGGEKKRTSVGVELVTKPPIVLLDEPTSGLDSFSAEQVVKVLTRVAQAGTSVLFTIHQPSSEVFKKFDNLILMNRGRIMFRGPLKDLDQEFANRNFPFPTNYNPADWILILAQERSDTELEENGFYTLEKDCDNEKIKEHDLPASALKEENDNERSSMWLQLVLLMEREKRNVLRNKSLTIINICVTGFLAFIYGLFFWGVGKIDRTDPLDVQAQLGALVNILLTTMMGQSQYAIVSFPLARPLFLREYSTNHFSVVPWFLSKLAAEMVQMFLAMVVQSLLVYFMIGFQMNFYLFFLLCYTLALTSTAVAVMLGSALSDPTHASQFYALVVVPQFYFSGVFAPLDLVPKFIRCVCLRDYRLFYC